MLEFTQKILSFGGQEDNQGHVFSLDCVATFKNPVPVKDANGDGFSAIMGTATLMLKDDGVYASINIDENSSAGKVLTILSKAADARARMWPAVNGGIIKRKGNVINEIVILAVDLTMNGNADSSIVPLKFS